MSNHSPDLDAGLDEIANSTDRLLATVDRLGDTDLSAPILLPGWTRAHVLTHVARQADGLVNLVRWATTGEATPMYADGSAGRDRAIAAGADRQIGDIRLDLTDSAELLLEAFADFPLSALSRAVELPSGATAQGWQLARLRVREVEIHHVDLVAGYTPGHWPASFVVRTLGEVTDLFARERDCPVALLRATDTESSWVTASSGPTLSGPQNALLAWLTGRGSGDGLDLTPAGAIPHPPAWS